MSFKLGDKVKLITDAYGDTKNNPVWGGECGCIVGTVTTTDYPILVKWNMLKTEDFYLEEYLSLIGMQIGQQALSSGTPPMPPSKILSHFIYDINHQNEEE